MWRGQWQTEFVYDGLRRRRITREYNWQSSGWNKTNEIRYIFDGLLPIQERDSNNVPVVTYTRGLDLSGSIHGAGGIGGLLARTDANGAAFYHADGTGNITALMDGNQNIVARYEYDPFGKLIGKWGAMADANHYRFSSKELHQNSGLYAYGFRFYEPNFQRWLNRDPIQERGGIDLYRFVGNNPLRWRDAWGLQTAPAEEQLGFDFEGKVDELDPDGAPPEGSTRGWVMPAQTYISAVLPESPPEPPPTIEQLTDTLRNSPEVNDAGRLDDYTGPGSGRSAPEPIQPPKCDSYRKHPLSTRLGQSNYRAAANRGGSGLCQISREIFLSNCVTDSLKHILNSPGPEHPGKTSG